MTSRRNRNMLVNIVAEIRTLRTLLLLLCCLLCEAGDETVTLQEVEGTTITLHTGITGIQRDAQILWFYGPEKSEEKILNSQVFKGETVTDISERFKERLQLDRISGALTIRNISRTDSGVYLLHVITGRLSSRTFSVSVYAPVSTPVIINERGKRSVISTESCFLLGSVENGEDVKLSWYRENERISITNNTDLSVPLNLPLQIQHNDINTYICVSANPVSNKTTSLIITQLCYVSDKSDGSPSLLPVLISAGVFLLLILTGFVWVWLKRKNNKLLKKLEEVTFTEVTITAHSAERVKKEEKSRITDDQELNTFVMYSAVETLT
ncbi:signaling lymphocytic activation molecule-like [Tachysurus fulvidraco]|uniref:signaling lymphocytic activation molecule-like n=1 Tax=Tachysurus fulvidraco TaxID=1234273 RepID=UPI001FF0056A|nr:signaling lymphocytic activation molecule-like [Tachysurus fulvidraco]XP_047671842.1 signaling lymphocytic activation molecule-like [Tachysurus fulvidraco]XP_047671843.1 signaling lymphocytic activation molecule-like [Tachysurus fulvidraco]